MNAERRENIENVLKIGSGSTDGTYFVDICYELLREIDRLTEENKSRGKEEKSCWEELNYWRDKWNTEYRKNKQK